MTFSRGNVFSALERVLRVLAAARADSLASTHPSSSLKARPSRVAVAAVTLLSLPSLPSPESTLLASLADNSRPIWSTSPWLANLQSSAKRSRIHTPSVYPSAATFPISLLRAQRLCLWSRRRRRRRARNGTSPHPFMRIRPSLPPVAKATSRSCCLPTLMKSLRIPATPSITTTYRSPFSIRPSSRLYPAGTQLPRRSLQPITRILFLPFIHLPSRTSSPTITI